MSDNLIKIVDDDAPVHNLGNRNVNTPGNDKDEYSLEQLKQIANKNE